MLSLVGRARPQGLLGQQFRAISTSTKRTNSASPVQMLPPLPPPEFEADGSPRKYPLYAAIHEHGYDWENWAFKGEGIWHTSYYGDLAIDYSAYSAWVQSMPVWVMGPFMLFCVLTFVAIFQKAGTIGIKPKRYTIEWQQAMKERERVENSNPVTRYLDRRVAERGWHLPLGDVLPFTGHVIWMSNSHDHDWREARGLPDLREGVMWDYKVRE